MPGTMLRVLLKLARIILMWILWGGGHYPCVADEKNEAQTLS